MEKTIDLKKKIGLLICSFAVVAAWIYSLSSPLAKFISIELPIAIKTTFDIPVVLWLFAFLYLVLVYAITGKRFKLVFAKVLTVTFLFHIGLTLLKLQLALFRDSNLLTPTIYRLYCIVFIFSVLSMVVIYALKKIILEHDFIIGYPLVVFIGYVLYCFFASKSVLFSAIFSIIIFMGFLIVKFIFTNEPIVKRLLLIKDFLIKEKVFISLIFIFAFLIRLGYLMRVMSNPDYLLTGSDGTLYDGLAQSFLSGEKVTEPLVAGYWMFLAFLYKLFGRSYLAVGLVQGFLLSCSCVFVYFIAKQIFNEYTGRIAAIVSVVSFSSIFSSNAIGHQAMDIFYVVFGMLLIVKYLAMKKEGKVNIIILALIGVVWGLAIATREINLFWPLLFFIWTLFYYFKKYPFRKTLMEFSVISLFIVLSLSPFLLRNYKNLGVVYPVSASSGASYTLIDHYFKGENPDLVNSDIDLSNPGRLIEKFSQKPLFVLKAFYNNFMKKFKDLYFSQGYGGFDLLFLYRMSNYYYTVWFYVYVIILFGILSAFMKKGFSVHFLMIMFIAYRTMVHFLTEASYRHRAAIEPFLAIYLAYGVFLIVNFIKNQNKTDEKTY